jgi:hypothetical protein
MRYSAAPQPRDISLCAYLSRFAAPYHVSNLRPDKQQFDHLVLVLALWKYAAGRCNLKQVDSGITHRYQRLLCSIPYPVYPVNTNLTSLS